MSTTPEKLTEIISVRISATMAGRLDAAAVATGQRRQDIARAGIMAEINRLDAASSDPEITVLLERCRGYDIDVKSVLHTALVEEQCSSIGRRDTLSSSSL